MCAQPALPTEAGIEAVASDELDDRPRWQPPSVSVPASATEPPSSRNVLGSVELHAVDVRIGSEVLLLTELMEDTHRTPVQFCLAVRFELPEAEQPPQRSPSMPILGRHLSSFRSLARAKASGSSFALTRALSGLGERSREARAELLQWHWRTSARGF